MAAERTLRTELLRIACAPMHRPRLPDGQRDYVIERRYDGTSQMPFSTLKLAWTHNALGRLVAETRDLHHNGQRDSSRA
jgi:hypothetical protein